MIKGKTFLIDRLIEENWFETPKEALPWVLSRKILVNDVPAASLKDKIGVDDTIRIREYYKKQYVNKGGLKLEGALRDFRMDVRGRIALDCGASTGGFTDCLLRQGAERVYAVDVGHGQLASKLINDPRVVNMERTNLSDIALQNIDPLPDLIMLDLSYLSLRNEVPICRDFLCGNKATLICLVKPLFEMESPEDRRYENAAQMPLLSDTLQALIDDLIDESTSISGITCSNVTGNRGTIEFFLCVEVNGQGTNIEIEPALDAAMERAKELQKLDKNSYGQDT